MQGRDVRLFRGCNAEQLWWMTESEGRMTSSNPDQIPAGLSQCISLLTITIRGVTKVGVCIPA